MKRLVFLFCGLLMAQNGKFKNGYEDSKNGVSIQIVEVHTGPRCRAEDTCDQHWMVIWTSKKQADQVEIYAEKAGMNFPTKSITVPGQRRTSLDKHNPVFDIPLREVHTISFIFWKGSKQIMEVDF